MGAVLDTPTRCPLCNEMTGEPVTLKCKHQFCQRCIGDLWSAQPQGPYHCPEWRCKTVYHTLPFDSSFIRTTGGSRWGPPPRSTAASSSNNGSNTPDSSLGRPSLTSRLLGKRKASTPATEQPETKRSTVEAPRETSKLAPSETPTTSSPEANRKQSTSGEPLKNVVNLDALQPEAGDGTRSSEAAPEPDNSVQQNRSEPDEVDLLDDSDSSSEVDLCDAPLPATPKRDQHTSQKLASPLGRDKSPRVGKPPLISTKHPASLSHAGIFPKPESRNTNPVPCHYCPKSRHQIAVQTCLVCGASMCTEHLRPHLESPVFQNHTLVPPMEDISTWRCQEHQEINRIYCRQCGVCVCTVCTVIGSHRDHICVSIREAEQELRGNLKEEIKQLQESEEEVKKRLAELTKKKEAQKVVLTEARAGVQQQYAAIKEALEQEEQSALEVVTKEESRVLGGLEEKLGHLYSSLQSIQHGLHSLEGLADAKGDKRIQDQAFIMEYHRSAQLASNLGNCRDQFVAPEEVDHARLNCLQRWTETRLDTVIITVPGKDRDRYRLHYGTLPSMDPDTAHPKLQLSENNQRVTHSDAQQAYEEHEARFSSFPQVLASTALQAGRWYWEVKVSVDEGRWKVGLSEGQIERKGQKDNSRLGFNAFSWCLACDRKKVEALHNKEAVPVDAAGLQRVGVFLDFEEGVLSFFNVTPGGSLALLHSYKHRFSEPLYPALSVSKTHLTICDLFQA